MTLKEHFESPANALYSTHSSQNEISEQIQAIIQNQIVGKAIAGPFFSTQYYDFSVEYGFLQFSSR